MLSDKEFEEMYNQAVETEKHALAFKSKHSLGASVLTWEGEVFGGCNIDGVISSQGTCAEVVAINKAVSYGKYLIKAVMVYDQNEIIFPCGACLQYLNQFRQVSGRDILIIATKSNKQYKIEYLSKLLPKGYLSEGFDKSLKKLANK